ncbi:MAG: polyamine aminopropyltransferase [Fervidicoccaceae archaeon]
MSWDWLMEELSPGEIVLRGIKRVETWVTTEYQEVAVVEIEGLGKTLVIDGKVQSSLYDEFVYHEALVHPAMVTHGRPRRVLIIGGGEGATLREVLRYKCVEEAIMVDIDRRVVELAKTLLPEWHDGAFDDPRAKVLFMDGRRYVEGAAARGESFDVVVVDVVDPLAGGPAVKLYTVEFYKLLKKLVGERGIMVTQATSPDHYPQVYFTVARTIAEVFDIVRPYVVSVRSFGGVWGFVLGSASGDPKALRSEEVDKKLTELLESAREKLRFYDGETHASLFNLPKHYRRMLSEPRRPSRDEEPVEALY